MPKNNKVLLCFDSPATQARGYSFKQEFNHIDWNTERDVYHALLENNYEVTLLGIHNDLSILIEELKENRPNIVFNLTDVFAGKTQLDKNFASTLEMLDIPFTGASPETLFICNNKALAKKILTYHQINIPEFKVYQPDNPIQLTESLRFPLIIKPLHEEASRGIALASIVKNELEFIARVNFIHDKFKMPAIAEEYIEGRELYISILGDKNLRALTPVEMRFGKIPTTDPHIATYKAKWDQAYRKKWGINNTPVSKFPKKTHTQIENICKQAFKHLNMQGYARFDLRITNEGDIFILEPNANPCLAKDDDFAKAAQKSGISYKQLIKKIINLGFKKNS